MKMTNLTNDGPVRGDIQPATPDGFANLIARANAVHAKGLTMVGVVNVGPKHLGAIYVKLESPRQGNLIGE